MDNSSKSSQKCCLFDRSTEQQFKEMIDFLKLMSDKNRLKILCCLKEKERCVCEIWNTVNLPQNLTSHHLKALKDFGLLKSRTKGRNIRYSFDKKMMKKYISLLQEFFDSHV